MDLFEYMSMQRKKEESPLAVRMRPKNLDEVAGQQHIIGKDKLLYRAIKADKISSLIFYGPPGTGKTTLAKVIANTTSANFVQMNATTSGKKDMEQAVSQAKDAFGMYGKRTILFIDEIHRFNKAQQDYLLPFVEDGTVILIGATTENPYFEVNSALLSRSQIFHLEPLAESDIYRLVKTAVEDNERGMGAYGAVITEEAARFIAEMAGGDARRALNAVELGVLTTEPDDKGQLVIDLSVAEECIQRKSVNYDRDGDNHYDNISAFIKSMRGTDPDAAVFYLARMLDAGEDPKFIARRIMICASEDVGNADPQALVVAVAASQGVERIGMPEARILLSQAAAYVASAPKSNACIMAVDKALEMVRSQNTGQVPPYLRDAHYGGAKKLGHGIGYKYAHDYPEHYVKQQYLPDELKEERFYVPEETVNLLSHHYYVQNISTGDNFYVPENTQVDPALLKEHTPHYIKNSEDIEKLPALEKILIIEEDPERIYEIKDLIHDNFDDELEIVISADDCLDLNIKGCSKKFGVEYISKELEINPKEIMAFGDSGNDYKMLKFVGHPVAMKDSFMAKRDIKNKTDFTNDESGVAKYLQQYFDL